MIKKETKFMLIGIFLAMLGVYIRFATSLKEGVFTVLPFIFIGLGFGILGHFLGEHFKRRVLKHNPNYSKKISIAQKDERNILISRMAKEKAYESMIFIFGILMLIFVLAQINMYVILAIVSAYLATIITFIYYFNKYNREV